MLGHQNKTPLADNSKSPMANRFSQLPHHLLEYLLNLVTKRLDLDDLLRFSCVCQQWRSFSAPLLPPKHLPWLIVPHKGYFSNQGTIFNKTLGFFSFYNHKTYKVELPQISNRRICGSCKGGWLITLHENGEIQLLHPFSKSVIELPPVTELPGVIPSVISHTYYCVPSKSNKKIHIKSRHMREFYIYKGITSSSSPTTGIVIIIYGVSRKLAFCRPRIDKKWVPINGNGNGNDNACFEDMVICRGDIYAVQDKGHVYVVCGLDSDSPFVKLVISEPSKMMYYRKHLVECYGEVFLVRRIRYPMEPGDEEAHLTLAFVIKKIDFDGPKWVDVEEIDRDSAIFVGCNDSFALFAKQFPACKRNSIYFTDDCLQPFVSGGLECFVDEMYGGYDIGIYTFADDVFDRFYPSASKLVKPPPVWFSTSSY